MVKIRNPHQLFSIIRVGTKGTRDACAANYPHVTQLAGEYKIKVTHCKDGQIYTGALSSFDIARNKWTEILIKQVLIDGVFRYMVKIGNEYIIDEETAPNTQNNMDLYVGASTGYANYLS